MSSENIIDCPRPAPKIPLSNAELAANKNAKLRSLVVSGEVFNYSPQGLTPALLNYVTKVHKKETGDGLIPETARCLDEWEDALLELENRLGISSKPQETAANNVKLLELSTDLYLVQYTYTNSDEVIYCRRNRRGVCDTLGTLGYGEDYAIQAMVKACESREKLDFFGQISGIPYGLHKTHRGEWVFCTRSPSLEEQDPGDVSQPEANPLIGFYVRNIVGLCRGIPELYHRLFYVMQLGLKDLHYRQAHPMAAPSMLPIICVMGDQGTGKSLLGGLFAEVLGGGIPGKARNYLLKGEGGENKFLCQSTVWELADTSIPYGKNDEFLKNLKSAHADPVVMMKALYADTVQVMPNKVFLISCNHGKCDDLVIPPIDAGSGYREKLIVFEAGQAPDLTSDRPTMDHYRLSQAPYVRHWLRHSYEAPNEVKAPEERTRVRCYIDPSFYRRKLEGSSLLGVLLNITKALCLSEGEFAVLTYQEILELTKEIEAGDKIKGSTLKELRRLASHMVKSYSAESTDTAPTLWVFRHGSDNIFDFHLDDWSWIEEEGGVRARHKHRKLLEHAWSRAGLLEESDQVAALPDLPSEDLQTLMKTYPDLVTTTGILRGNYRELKQIH